MNSKAFRDRSISKHLGELREENKRLTAERERLRVVLCDREEDVRAIRTQLARSGGANETMQQRRRSSIEEKKAKELSQLVLKLEKMQGKYKELRQDLQVRAHDLPDLICMFVNVINRFSEFAG